MSKCSSFVPLRIMKRAEFQSKNEISGNVTSLSYDISSNFCVDYDTVK